MLIDIEKINFVHFSGGEVHLNAKDFFAGVPEHEQAENDIVWSPIHDSTDLMELLILTDAYKRHYMRVPKVCIPYIPYARQDRVANDGEALSIKVFADIINAQNYPCVYVMDPHSDVSMALLNNVKVIKNVDDSYLKEVIPNYCEKFYVVLAPDAGSYKRLGKVIKEVPLIYATKQRDTKTGALSNVEIHTGGLDLGDRTILVVDDICDGGGTFILLAQALRKAGIHNDLELYVTHGIFSKGTDELYKYYYPIYTTNSFFQGYDTNVKMHDLKKYLNR